MPLDLQFASPFDHVERHLAAVDRVVADTFDCIARCRHSAALTRASDAKFRLQIEQTLELLRKERPVYR